MAISEMIKESSKCWDSSRTQRLLPPKRKTPLFYTGSASDCR